RGRRLRSRRVRGRRRRAGTATDRLDRPRRRCGDRDRLGWHPFEWLFARAARGGRRRSGLWLRGRSSRQRKGQSRRSSARPHPDLCLELHRRDRSGWCEGSGTYHRGGLVDNPPRVLPDDLGIVFDLSAWELPPIFRWLSRTGSIPRAEMLRTFNCGIGMIAVTSPDDAERIERVFADSGERTFRIGTVAPPAEGEPRIAFERPDAWLGV